MRLKYLLLITGFAALSAFQSSAQSSLKTASPGLYPTINQLPGHHKPPIPKCKCWSKDNNLFSFSRCSRRVIQYSNFKLQGV